MARGILELLNDPARCAALGKAARVKAVEQYSIDAFCGSHYASYLRLSGKVQVEETATAPSTAEQEEVAESTDMVAPASRGHNSRAEFVPVVV